MSVIIKEMEMPKSCSRCTLEDGFTEYDCECKIGGFDTGEYKEERHPDCPLEDVEDNNE